MSVPNVTSSSVAIPTGVGYGDHMPTPQPQPEYDPLLDAYASLADELNDVGVTLSVRDFDPEMVDRANQYAKANGLAFPPSTGDFDRFWEAQQDARRRARFAR